MATVRREGGRLLARVELHARAWSEALDPTTKSWVARARGTQPDRSAEEARADLQRRLGDLRARR